MLQLTPQHRLLLAIEPVDFRKGICGLKGQCLNNLDLNPFSGTVFAWGYKNLFKISDSNYTRLIPLLLKHILRVA